MGNWTHNLHIGNRHSNNWANHFAPWLLGIDLWISWLKLWQLWHPVTKAMTPHLRAHPCPHPRPRLKASLVTPFDCSHSGVTKKIQENPFCWNFQFSVLIEICEIEVNPDVIISICTHVWYGRKWITSVSMATWCLVWIIISVALICNLCRNVWKFLFFATSHTIDLEWVFCEIVSSSINEFVLAFWRVILWWAFILFVRHSHTICKAFCNCSCGEKQVVSVGNLSCGELQARLY